MDLRRLRYFAVAAAEGSLHAAAARLNVAQPALSRQIRDLEDELGVTLFLRSARGVALTPAGEVMAKEVERLFSQVELAISRTKRASRGESGRLRIGVTMAFAELKFFVQAFAETRKAYPDVDLELRLVSSEQQVRALQHGTIDAGVFHRRYSQEPGVSWRDLRVDRYKLMVSSDHPLTRRGVVRLADLRDEELIFGAAPPWSEWPETRAEIMAAFMAVDAAPRKLTEQIGNLPTVISLVAEGIGVSIMNSSVEQAYPHAEVAFLDIDDMKMPLNLCVAWRNTGETPALKSFVERIAEKASQHTPADRLVANG